MKFKNFILEKVMKASASDYVLIMTSNDGRSPSVEILNKSGIKSFLKAEKDFIEPYWGDDIAALKTGYSTIYEDDGGTEYVVVKL